MFSASNKRPSGYLCGLYLPMMLMLLVMNKGGSLASIVPMCPSEEDPKTDIKTSYCQCNQKPSRSGTSVSIICDFLNKEDVILTDALYPFRRGNLMQVYMQVSNATSIWITESFLREIQNSPSVALDIWRSGKLTFDSSPKAQQQNFLPSYSTYFGIGIVNCTIPLIPKALLRDRMVGGLLIGRSRVGTISQGSLYNINKMRYLVIEDTVVEKIEGAIANRNPLALEPGTSATWHGFKIKNANIGTIESTAFRLAYEGLGKSSRTCEAKVINSRFGELATEAITITGKLDLTIDGNTFRRLKKYALKINVTGDLKFEGNVIKMLEPGGLKGLICGSRTSMDKNTIHLNSPYEMAYSNSSEPPFAASCGNPQVFIVMSPPQPRNLKKTSNATWVLLTLLLLFVSLLVFGGLYIWRSQTFDRQYRRGVVPLGTGVVGRTTFNELHHSTELGNVEDVSSDTGVSNPVYDIKEPS